MSEKDFAEQARELEELLRESHLTAEVLADRAHLKPETFRKYLGGYQKCGRRTMDAIRDAAKLEIQRLQRALGRAVPDDDRLHDEVVRYAGKLLDMNAEDRDLAKQMIDKLARVSSGKSQTGKLVEEIVESLVTQAENEVKVKKSGAKTSGQALASDARGGPLSDPKVPSVKKQS